MMTDKQVDKEMEQRYGYFPGEHPDRAKIRLILETEPMSLWLARAEIRRVNVSEEYWEAELEGPEVQPAGEPK